MIEVTETARFGERVRALRHKAGLSQAELAQRCGLAPSSVSKIETGQMSPTYDVLLRLAKGLALDLSDLLAPERRAPERRGATPGMSLARLAVSRAGEGPMQNAGVYTYFPLATGLRRKLMDPTLVRLETRDIHGFGELIRHPGEEFVLVLEGAAELHTEHYEVVRLEKGDSCYYDATMGHAFVRAADGPALILNITAHPAPVEVSVGRISCAEPVSTSAGNAPGEQHDAG
jgi:transcriptional regulator with XRE-family HTH domain